MKRKPLEELLNRNTKEIKRPGEFTRKKKKAIALSFTIANQKHFVQANILNLAESKEGILKCPFSIIAQ